MTNRITRSLTMTEQAALARLLCFASPAFPTGGFAYSHGLEWAVETKDVTNAGSLSLWIATLLSDGSGRSDTILLRHAHRAAALPDALADIIRLAGAVTPSFERHLEALGQGNAFAAAARAWGGATVDAAYPVAFGVFTRRQGLEEDAACIGYLAAWTSNLVSAGVRLIPLGQSDGLRVLAGLQADLLAIVGATRSASLDDIGTACFAADIASMQHETQYSRMFRS
jgi:urease accessory protein